MSTDFEVGEIDDGFDEEELENEREKEREKEKEKERNGGKRVKVEKFKVCEDKSLSHYVPCLDNVEEIKRLNLGESVEKYERHCPPQPLDCVVARPEGYQVRIPWPQSRNQVTFISTHQICLLFLVILLYCFINCDYYS